MTAADWIERLQLQPHPEGGHFRRIYTDTRDIATATGPRSAVTSIHYLLSRDSPIGRLHRNRSRILHFLQHGGPVDYWLLAEDGTLTRKTLGWGSDQSVFLEVPGHVWKASILGSAADCALISEVVIPGFDYADHEFLTAADLHRRYPQHAVALQAWASQ